MNYETFAAVYDSVMDDSLYPQWLDFTKRHLTENVQTILELACGTGDLAILLAQNNYQVTGLDLSNEMLTIADRKAFDADCQMQFLQGDMRDLKDVGAFDAVTCFSDSLCYLSDEPDMQLTFDEVFSVLNDGGTFIFDVHSVKQIEEGFKDYSFHDQTEEFAFLWDSYPGLVPHSVEHFLTFFVQENGETFIRHDELHQERTYPVADFLRMLENAGFTKVEVFGDFTDEAPTKECKRVFFVAHKD